MQPNSLKDTNKEVHFYESSIRESCCSTKDEFLHRYFSRILNENLRIPLSGCFRINLHSPSLNQKVGKTTFVGINLQQIEKSSYKNRKKNLGLNLKKFLSTQARWFYVFLIPYNKSHLDSSMKRISWNQNWYIKFLKQNQAKLKILCFIFFSFICFIILWFYV